MLRFISLCCLLVSLTLGPFASSSFSARAADISSTSSTLEDSLPDESLPDAPATEAPLDDAEPSLAVVDHAPLPSLTVLQGICSLQIQASGLLDHLAPFLARETGIVIQWRAVDDRRAEALARSGDGDLLLTAMPDKEKILVREGRAEQRLEIIHDGYILAGPEADPAQIRGKDIVEALCIIADTGAPFVSRGDASATHKRERALWKKAGRDVRDEQNGYVESAQNAPATLALADALGAYTLTDVTSLLTHQAAHGPSLSALIEKQPALSRVWSLLPLNPPSTGDMGETDAAAAALRTLAVHSLLDWWQQPSTKERVARFTREGQTIFTPLPDQELPQETSPQALPSF